MVLRWIPAAWAAAFMVDPPVMAAITFCWTGVRLWGSGGAVNSHFSPSDFMVETAGEGNWTRATAGYSKPRGRNKSYSQRYPAAVPACPLQFGAKSSCPNI